MCVCLGVCVGVCVYVGDSTRKYVCICVNVHVWMSVFNRLKWVFRLVI